MDKINYITYTDINLIEKYLKCIIMCVCIQYNMKYIFKHSSNFTRIISLTLFGLFSFYALGSD